MGFIVDHLSGIQWDSRGIHENLPWNSVEFTWDSMEFFWNSLGFNGIHLDSMGFMVDRKQSIISPSGQGDNFTVS